MPKLLYVFLAFLFLVIFIGCEPVCMGNSSVGFKEVPNAKIQPKETVELAMPYLDKTFELRTQSDGSKQRGSTADALIYVTLKEKYYYIVKEDCPAKSVYYYLDHAVRVDKDTGEVFPLK